MFFQFVQLSCHHLDISRFSFSILSFGAPAANVYKIIVDGRDPMIFETPQVGLQGSYSLNPLDLDHKVIEKWQRVVTPTKKNKLNPTHKKKADLY